jgi:hypothetical protein
MFATAQLRLEPKSQAWILHNLWIKPVPGELQNGPEFLAF